MDNDDSVSTMRVPWGRLKAWIEAQEAAEQSGHNPNPPSKVQVAALSHVVDFMDEPEPTFGTKDFVSDLMSEQHPRFLSYLHFSPLSPPANKKKYTRSKAGVKSNKMETIEFSS